MFPVRLACVKHAASVHPEPGSNSLIKCLIHFRTTLAISRFTVLGFTVINRSFKNVKNFRESYVFHCLVIKVVCCLSTACLFYHILYVCQELFSSFLQLRRELRRYSSQSHNPRTGRPASASVPCPGFIFFPAGWKCQPEGEDIGSGCCGGGVIQLRSRERALLRQGQLFEPAASSGPAAMVLAISRNLSCIPRRSPCPGRYPLPLAYHLSIPLTEPLPTPTFSPP